MTERKKTFTTFATPISFAINTSRRALSKHPVQCSRTTTSRSPRLVVLPGMDGTALLLNNFRKATSSADDPNRVIAVDYPFDGAPTIPELGEFVRKNYIAPLQHDDRGYILVNQSFSGHVGFYLSQQILPGTMLGQVFVNAFVANPAPALLTGIPAFITDPLFRNQPPPWLVGRLFLGEDSSEMATVQSAAAQNASSTMSHRLSLCLQENAWHIWRQQTFIPSHTTLYLRGDDDFILRKDQARKIHLARRDIEWVHVPKGPHLLLQSHGELCGIAVNKFCDRICGTPNSVP